VRRLLFVLATTGFALVALAAPAWAHVSVSPTTATKGDFVTLTFQVPNEEANANTTKVEVQFPQDHPISDASVQPVTGWTIKVDSKKLATPITTADGDTLDSSVNTVTWTASAAAAIKPGEFQQFRVSIGVPDDADSLSFPAIQTYSDGTKVSWIEQTPPGGPEPEHPAPVVTLTSGDNGGAATPAATTTNSDDSDTAKTIAIVGLIVGAVGLIIAIVALVASRKKPATS
jgi:uncharacterized protein YcnI